MAGVIPSTAPVPATYPCTPAAGFYEIAQLGFSDVLPASTVRNTFPTINTLLLLKMVFFYHAFLVFGFTMPKHLFFHYN